MQSHACVYFVFLGIVGVIILVIFEVNPSKLADGGVNLLKITVKRRSKGTSFLFMSPGSRRKNGYDRMSKNYASHSCVSRVKSPVHSRFATYPDVSCRI